MNLLQNHSGPSGDLEIISLVWAHYPHYALFLNDFTTSSVVRLSTDSVLPATIQKIRRCLTTLERILKNERKTRVSFWSSEYIARQSV